MKIENENHDWHCLDCDEICDISEVKFDEDGEMVCPECGGDSIVEL